MTIVLHLPFAEMNWWLDPFQLFTIPLDEWVTAIIDFLVDNFRPIFQTIQLPVRWLLNLFQDSLTEVPPSFVLLLLSVIVWQVAGGRIGIYCFSTLLFIGFLDLWQEAMVSLSLVLTSLLLCILFGIPLGVLSARSDRFDNLLKPLLDAMQTLPVFVYLVPVVMLFGIGEVPGIIATIVYALPPLIRLTNLGIRQVPEDVIEASVAFGATPNQTLFGVQLPLAMPMILAGVNQTVLFALGMSVVTSMIAVPGLGLMVLRGLGNLDVGVAAVGGVGILGMAILLDRITQAIGKKQMNPQAYHGPLGVIQQWLAWKQKQKTMPSESRTKIR
ncbi:MAG: ABC transporter permease subunit [Leptolyngbyaceae bacterium]|nr:ABC transporter permease subunit [Leptolyngbyaceae bacterium]